MALAYGKKVDIGSLLDDLGILADTYYSACRRVRECRNCVEGWIVETWDDGREHQNRCPYCWDNLCTCNREWRKVRDEITGAGHDAPTLDDWQRRLSDWTANRPTDPVGAEMVGQINQAWRAHRDGEISLEELGRRIA